MWTDVPCILWTGPKDKDGYGKKQIGHTYWRVHRLSWTQTYGPIPSNTLVLHRCDNPPCYEITHLYLGTSRDNMNDKVQKNRQSKGSTHGMHKLIEEEVVEIRRKYAAGGLSQWDLAFEYGVKLYCIQAVVTGKTWKHVDGPIIKQNKGSKRLAWNLDKPDA